MSISNNKIRVLIIETNPGRRETLQQNLSQTDAYEIYTAEGEGDALLVDARKKFMAHYCHVVITAPRLRNPADPEDFSGLLAGPAFAPAGMVIYAAEADDMVAYRAGLERMGYVRSFDPRQRLIDVVEEQAKRRPFTIQWTLKPELNLHVAEALQIEPDQVTAEDLRILLGQAFPKANGVALKPMPALETNILAATPVRRATVLWTQENRLSTNYLTPKVTKIGARERIEREVANYNTYVDGRLRQDRQARLEGHALLWHIGAVAYTFLGASPDELKPFRSFYVQNNPSNILTVLKGLFTHTCANWYEDRETTEEVNLYELYNTALNLDEHLSRMDQTKYRLMFNGVAGEFPNPALWVVREGKNIVLPQAQSCVSHGDLHSDNFFVDSSKQVWLIDFEQTGKHHVFRDFVELEADIKLRLTQYPEANELGTLAALERSLLNANSLTSLPVPDYEVMDSAPAFKAFQVISGIRHLAALATGIKDLREYNQALLYESVFMATLNRLRDTVRQRALLSAAILADHMTKRTGLLNRQPSMPRLETAQLTRAGNQARRQLDHHQAHLTACYRTTELIAGLYMDHPPAELVEGVRQLQQERQRVQMLKARLNPGND